MVGEMSTADEMTMLMTAVVPLSMHPNAKTAAVIGFGSGMTTGNYIKEVPIP